MNVVYKIIKKNSNELECMYACIHNIITLGDQVKSTSPLPSSSINGKLLMHNVHVYS